MAHSQNSLGGHPELIADLSYITYVWEVKAASDMSKPSRNDPDVTTGDAYTNQIDKYVTGLTRMGLFNNVQKGHDIIPEVAPTPDGNSLVIFSADNWQLSFPNAKTAAEPDGIIYYRKIFKAKTPAPAMPGNENGQGEAGAGIGEAAVSPGVTRPVTSDGVVASEWYEDPVFWGVAGLVVLVGGGIFAIAGCIFLCGGAAAAGGAATEGASGGAGPVETVIEKVGELVGVG